MINVKKILKRIDDSDVGSSEYHYAMAEYCQFLASQVNIKEEHDGCIERSMFHKLLGDTFKKEK